MRKEELQKYVIWALIVIFAALTAYNMRNCNNSNNTNRIDYQLFDYYKAVDLICGEKFEILDYSIYIGQTPEYNNDTVIILKQVLKKSK